VFPASSTDPPELHTDNDPLHGTKPRRITAGDLLNISVWREPNLTVTLSVRSDGTISFPLLNELQAAGQNPDELEKVITEKLRRYVRSPRVTVKESYVMQCICPTGHNFRLAVSSCIAI
jgi:polysaccharide export outer membrane protein